MGIAQYALGEKVRSSFDGSSFLVGCAHSMAFRRLVVDACAISPFCRRLVVSSPFQCTRLILPGIRPGFQETIKLALFRCLDIESLSKQPISWRNDENVDNIGDFIVLVLLLAEISRPILHIAY